MASQNSSAPIETTAMPGFEMPDETPVAIAKGFMKIGDVEIECAVLVLNQMFFSGHAR